MNTSLHKDGLSPGIYFGLDENIYHKDKAVSRSDIVNILDTPNTYWRNSWMNSERGKKKNSEEMEYGSAFHMLLFEPARFEREYQVVPIDPWDKEKRKISDVEFYAIVESINVLRKGKDSSLFLSGGMPEVTIIFDHDGVRYRTRHDYFTPYLSTDFKTARSLEIPHIKSEFLKRGLDIQMYLYKLSRTIIKRQIKSKEAHVYGNADREFLKKFLDEENDEFMFIFQRKTEPYPFLPLWPEDDTESNGRTRAENAAYIYKKYRKEYGVTPWPVSEGKTKRFSMFYGVVEDN